MELIEKIDLELKINKHSLEDEVAEQSRRYMHWSQRCSKAQEDQFKAKLEMERVMAGVDLEYRENPTKIGVEKVTEAAISNAVKLNERVVKIQDDFSKARYDASVLESAKAAFDQRRTMLKLLGDLWLGQYYSDLEVQEISAPGSRKRIKK